ncbi:acyl-CoA dehydrogenase [Spartinivicinus poritis]|uniref:Acyl-coenzyme A dehydrogenase n=1 Tax=Spartinivicinus poritis TaxID=2994640 RepID=A0ABT5U9S2_9GAMM|nr:acyl-CoA dehydrogenase [Spartinivicinus sp. A2-2]MDE1463105.1 acyl-CoA dehydrogenase [Spartinivicinus sp. A2-2]
MTTFRQRWVSGPLLRHLKAVLPPISETERQALEAGGVWWDSELLSGKPDWSVLHSIGKPKLTEEEQAFLDGPVTELCKMIDDWEITFEHRDIPAPIWQFLKEKRFFGMIIPKCYGGLEFSAYAHSEVVTRIATCSTTVAVTVMVPNSLGPGELLMEFGTDEQKEHYLPRLADGRDIPCFGLTSPEAGSDAAAMIDKGVVCYEDYNGKRTLGMRVNWHKRYITLGPVATLLGLAFKLYDPDHLLGEKEELGITVALVPTNTSGVEIGERHYPAFQAFQNGPNWGRDVFIPMDWIIGGQERIGEGWKMLMSALAAGRSISLPSLSTGGAKLAARSTGAYARIREQFNVPIGMFEGVQQRLARIAGYAYMLDSARKTTTWALDQGKVPAVISAILKAHSTNCLRESINDAMDVHGGKSICDGPSNYLGNFYRSIPVAITVEGANILTCSLIIFGQGAMRCHPYLLDELHTAEIKDEAVALEKFDALIAKHLIFQLKTFGRAWFHAWTGGYFANNPDKDGTLRRHYQQVERYASALTLVSEVALLTLGGELKRKEFLSARLGDVLSQLYLISCVLKRFDDDGRQQTDLPLVDWCVQNSLWVIEQRLAEVIANFPSRPLAWLMRFYVLPRGASRKPPSDKLTQACAELLLSPSDTRQRLTEGVFVGDANTGVGRVEAAFEQVINTQPLRDKIKANQLKTIEQAVAQGIITDLEAQRLKAAEQAVTKAIEVDYFTASYLSQLKTRPGRHAGVKNKHKH